MSEFSQFKSTPSSSPVDVKDAVARQQLQSTQTASGNPLALTDAAPINAESLVVELEPKQDLHGYDYPWTGGCGKNKLPLDLATIKSLNNTDGTWSGNVFTHNDGVTFTILTDSDGNVTGINVNGTANADVSFTVGTAVSSGATYTFNGCPSGGSENTYYASVTYMGNDIGQGNYNKTIEQGNLLIYSIKIKANATVTNQIFYPMIILSTSTTAYEPYSNICPITGYDECNVDDVGFNQWDEEWEVGNLDNTTGQTDSTAGYIRSKNFCKCKGNESYCAKAPTADSMRVFWYDSGNNFIESVSIPQNNSVVITSPSNAAYFKLKTYATTYNHDISINYPSTITEYVPYHSSNATIQFGQTVYGGRSNFTDGGTDDDTLLVELDSLTWNYESGLTRFYSNTISGMKSSGVTSEETMCSCFKPDGSPIGGSHIDGTIVAYSGRLYANYFECTDATEFTSLMQGQTLTVPRASVTHIDTPSTDLKLLKGTNNLTTNGTTINLGYQPDNVIGEVKGEIEKITEMPYLRILDNDVDTEIKNYRLYYHLISGAYTLVNMGEMLQHRFIFVEVIKNPSGSVNKKVLHSALIDPRTIDGYEYEMKASGNDTIWIESILDENKFSLSLRTTGGSYSDGDPTDYYVTIRMVD